MDSFSQWRTKRERDPSVGRVHKKFITEDKLNRSEKENKDLNLFTKDKLEIDNLNESKSHIIDILNDLDNEDRKSMNMDIALQAIQQQAQNKTLKEKLATLNNSKYVIEEEEIENDELVLELDDDSDYEYNGEGLEEDDENYVFNEYPDEKDDLIDYYEDYKDDDENEETELMFKHFKNWKGRDEESDDDQDYNY